MARHNIRKTLSINKSDIIYLRHRATETTQTKVDRLENILNDYRTDKVILNDIRYFYNHDSKDKSMRIWAKNGLSTPRYIAIDKEDSFDKAYEKVISFKNSCNRFFLRINNDTGSKGIFDIDNKKSDQFIKKVLAITLENVQRQAQTRTDTRVMACEFIEPEQLGQYVIYRAHVVLNKIISFYVVPSSSSTAFNKGMEVKHINAFIDLNYRFEENITDSTLYDKIIKSVHSVGCNIGAVEFIMKGKEPIFIELNHHWGGHAGRRGFGNSEFQQYLNHNKNDLEMKIPTIYNWLDYSKYYLNLYKVISEGR